VWVHPRDASPLRFRVEDARPRARGEVTRPGDPSDSVASIERYGPGQEAAGCLPGDFILVHRHHPVAALISQAQKRRFKGWDAAYARWSHAAVVIATDGALVDTEALGIQRSPIAKYRASEYHLVRLGSEISTQGRVHAAQFAEGQVGQAFGYLEMLGAGLCLLFGWPLRLVRRNHEICSGLVVRSLQGGGLLSDFDAALTLPADLAKRFGARL